MNTLPSDKSVLGLHSLEDYEPTIGRIAVQQLKEKAGQLASLHVTNISSTYYGGGVAEILSPLTLLMNESGISTDWHIIQGSPEFFAVTKQIHNGLQGEDVELSSEAKRIYEEVALENATRMQLDHDVVIVHDPQPLPLIQFFPKRAPWIWCCHIDLSAPNPSVWSYVSPFIAMYDAIVLSMPEYAVPLQTPQRFIMPAINPFSTINRPLSDEAINACLQAHGIPSDLPLVVQASRFDKWKDPEGVIDAFCAAREKMPCRLVLVGNEATDDPEGQLIYEKVCKAADESIMIISVQDATLVNALQRRAAVVLQKSLREGFGLTVAEAMWKGAAVIGGNVGGIKHQIEHGANGFLVDSPTEATVRILELLRNPCLRSAVGSRAKATVKDKFLLPRLMDDWLSVISETRQSFDPERLSFA